MDHRVSTRTLSLESPIIDSFLMDIFQSPPKKKWESIQRIWSLYSIHALWCVHTNTSSVCLYKWANERATNMRIISQLYIFRFSKFKTITQRNVRYFKVIGVKLMKINLEDFCQLVVDRSQFFFQSYKNSLYDNYVCWVILSQPHVRFISYFFLFFEKKN